jgi:hypothetical protein
MSLHKSECWYSNNGSQFLKCTVPLRDGEGRLLCFEGLTSKEIRDVGSVRELLANTKVIQIENDRDSSYYKNLSKIVNTQNTLNIILGCQSSLSKGISETNLKL